jgi:hypothetical protein
VGYATLPGLTQDYHASDVETFLETGWRFNQGHVPHTDFSSPLGFLHPLLVALSLRLTGDGRAVLFVPLFLVPILAAALWPVVSRDPSRVRGGVVAFFVLGLLLTPTSLGKTSSFAASFAMQYNRMGWALLACLQLRLFVLPRERPSATFGDVAWNAALVALLLACKVNYVMAAVGSCALAWVVGASSLRRTLATLGAAVAAWALLLLVSGGSPLAAIADQAGVARQGGLRMLLQRAEHLVRTEAGVVGALLLYAGVLGAVALRAGVARRDLLRAAAAAAGIVGLGIVLNVANMQSRDVPAYAVAALVFDRRLELAQPIGAPARLLALGGLVFVGMFAVRDVHTLATVTLREHGMRFAPPPGRETAIPALRGLRYVADEPSEEVVDQVLADGDVATSQSSAERLEDLYRLARRNFVPGDRPALLDSGNPLPFCLQADSPRGLPAFWDVGRTVPAAATSRVVRAYESATLLVVPRYRSRNATFVWLLDAMQDALESDWRLVDESPLYRAYRRRSPT